MPYQLETPFAKPKIASVVSLRVEIAAKLPLAHAVTNDGFKDFLEPARPFAHPTAAAIGQELALGEKDPHEIAAVEDGHHMGPDQPCQPFPGLSRAGGDRLCRLEKACHPLNTDEFQSGLFGRDVVIKARLTDAQDVGDILRGGAVVAALGKDLGCCFDDLDRTAMGVSFCRRAWTR